MRRAPFAPLVAGGAELRTPPGEPAALVRRMAEVYGVSEDAVLPTHGTLHAFETAMRLAALEGAGDIVAPPVPRLARLAAVLRLSIADEATKGTGVVLADPQSDAEAAFAFARRIAPALVVIDESEIEASDIPSLAGEAAASENLLVVRSLESVYGLAGAPCGAIIANPALIARLEAVVDSRALPTPTVKLALDVLDPTRVEATRARIGRLKSERARIEQALQRSPRIRAARGAGAGVVATPADLKEAMAEARRFGLAVEPRADGSLRISLGDEGENDRILAAFGVADARSAPRVADIVRETSETRIVACVDIDREGKREIDTGIGFFDHMIDQIAAHGGFSVTLACRGDLEIDGHHTIEDCALAFGAALGKALGERRGIARFGFALPMDEAEAKVTIDLGGRPYLVFEGDFRAPSIGAYPTEMTEHVFRSLAQSLGASIHVAVTGENDHHKTEACFKAFGRALRQAIRVEGGSAPSTKGAIL